MKQYHRYHLDFTGSWARASAICMGASLFLLAVYFFGLTAFGDHGAMKILFSLCLPLLVSAAFIVLLQILRWDAPGIYGILGVLLCAGFLVSTFFSGNVFRIILGAAWYVICATVILAVTGGYLPGRALGVAVFGISIAVRLLFFDIGRLGLADWIGEGATLCAMASLMCLPMALIPTRSKGTSE
ncbi:MAG: hypothetical protein J6L24_05940 [Oscillospiraceae bacterium]|nr:hypothetical protein [Oscillospiraceae bacterium]